MGEIFEPENQALKKVPIHWIFGITVNDKELSIGLCGWTGKCALIGYPTILPLFVNSAFIENGQCEFGHRCCVLDCEFNETTPASFVKAHDLSSEAKSKRKQEKILNEAVSMMRFFDEHLPLDAELKKAFQIGNGKLIVLE